MTGPCRAARSEDQDPARRQMGQLRLGPNPQHFLRVANVQTGVQVRCQVKGHPRVPNAAKTIERSNGSACSAFLATRRNMPKLFRPARLESRCVDSGV